MMFIVHSLALAHSAGLPCALMCARFCSFCSCSPGPSSAASSFVSAPAREQVGPPLPRAPQRLREAPASNLCVMPRQQHVGHRHSFVHLRPRVVRAVEQAVHERILARRLLVVQRAGQQPRDRVDQHQRRQLAARHHEIAHRDFLVDLARDQPLVDAFVPSREQHVARVSLPPPAPPPARAAAARPRATGGSRAAARHRPAAAPPSPPRSPAPAAPASITIPGPPPYGRSSTVRCASVAKSRGFHIRSRHRPALQRAPRHSHARRLLHHLRETA